MKNKWTALILVLALSVSSLCGCGSSKSGSTSSTGSVKYSKGHVDVKDSDGDGILEGGTFTMALGGDMVKFDPAYCYDPFGLPVINQVCEPLLRFKKDEDGKLVTEPCLAESYKQVSATEWTFKIREGVKFSDGTDMTMDDILFSLNRMKKDAYAAQFYDNVKSIEATDEWNMKITLSKPDATFQYAIAHQSGFAICSKKYYEEHKDTFGDPSTGCIGTGPYAFKSWTQGEEIVLEKNKNYWDKGAYLDEVIFDIIPESTTRVSGLQSGQINAMLQVPIDSVDTISKLDNINLQIEDTFGIDFIAINTTKAPFDDVNVRKALNYAFDSEGFAEKICKQVGETGYSGSVPKALWTGEDNDLKEYESKMEPYGYDMTKAKECLAKSKYPSGFDATITTDSDPVRYNAALYLQASAKEIGINLEIEKVSGEQLTARSFEDPKNYDLMPYYWGSDFPDPIGLLGCCLLSKNAKGGANFSNFTNKEFDKIVDSQDAMTDNAERGKVFVKALEIVDEQCPWIMIDYANTTLALSKDMEGYTVTGLWYLNDFTRLLHYVE